MFCLIRIYRFCLWNKISAQGSETAGPMPAAEASKTDTTKPASAVETTVTTTPNSNL